MSRKRAQKKDDTTEPTSQLQEQSPIASSSKSKGKAPAIAPIKAEDDEPPPSKSKGKKRAREPEINDEAALSDLPTRYPKRARKQLAFHPDTNDNGSYVTGRRLRSNREMGVERGQTPISAAPPRPSTPHVSGVAEEEDENDSNSVEGSDGGTMDGDSNESQYQGSPVAPPRLSQDSYTLCSPPPVPEALAARKAKRVQRALQPVAPPPAISALLPSPNLPSSSQTSSPPLFPPRRGPTINPGPDQAQALPLPRFTIMLRDAMGAHKAWTVSEDVFAEIDALLIARAGL